MSNSVPLGTAAALAPVAVAPPASSATAPLTSVTHAAVVLPAPSFVGPNTAPAPAAVLPSAPIVAGPTPNPGVAAALDAAGQPADDITRANRALARSSPIPLAYYPPVNVGDRNLSTHCRFCVSRLPLVRDAELDRIYTPHPPTAKIDHSPPPTPPNQIAYCVRHHVITITIPEGVDAGYPQTFNPSRLLRRMQVPWIWRRVHSIISNPLNHQPFVDITNELRTKTLREWELDPLRFQSPPVSGYYGDVGFYIILARLAQSYLSGSFPRLATWVGGHMQLTGRLFLHHIVTPAVIICLIMEDLNPTIESMYPEDRDGLRAAATTRARRSHGFGQALHGLNEEQIVDITRAIWGH